MCDRRPLPSRWLVVWLLAVFAGGECKILDTYSQSITDLVISPSAQVQPGDTVFVSGILTFGTDADPASLCPLGPSRTAVLCGEAILGTMEANYTQAGRGLPVGSGTSAPFNVSLQPATIGKHNIICQSVPATDGFDEGTDCNTNPAEDGYASATALIEIDVVAPPPPPLPPPSQKALPTPKPGSVKPSGQHPTASPGSNGSSSRRPTKRPSRRPSKRPSKRPTSALGCKSGQYLKGAACSSCVSAQSPFSKVYGGRKCYQPVTVSRHATACSAPLHSPAMLTCLPHHEII